MIKSNNVIFLDKNRFDFYNEEQNKTYSFDLSQFVNNLEIVNKQEFDQAVAAFVTTNKISTGGIIIVLSESVLFVKALPPDTEISLDDEKEGKFINSVPFEHVSFKTYPIEGGKLLVATNKDFYSYVKSAFEKLSFTTNIVTPIYSSGVSTLADSGLTPDAAKTLLKNEGVLRTNAIEALEEKEVKPSPIVTTGKPEKKRLIALLSVFGVLILVLVIVTVISLRTPSVPTTNQSQNQISVSPTIPVVAEVASTSGELTVESTSVRITYPDGSISVANILRDRLASLGYKNITLQSTTTTSTNSLLLTNDLVSQEAKTAVYNNVSQIVPSIISQEVDRGDADIVILIGK